jgi:hypothetical protein
MRTINSMALSENGSRVVYVLLDLSGAEYTFTISTGVLTPPDY